VVSRGPLFVAIALVLAGALSASITGGAAAKVVRTLPTTPTCTLFSTAKISAVLRTGRMYLVHSFHAGPDSNCTYYGVTRAQASALANDSVPYNQIKYYPSLMIAIETTTPALLDVELGLLRKGYAVDRVAGVLKPFSEEWFSSGTMSGANMMPCQTSGALYSNWLGGPDCKGQPGAQAGQRARLHQAEREQGTTGLAERSSGIPAGKPLDLAHARANRGERRGAPVLRPEPSVMASGPGRRRSIGLRRAGRCPAWSGVTAGH
jgi:hypothetical protein